VPPPEEANDAQAEANDGLWARTDLVRHYTSRELRPVETIILARYHTALSGRVLELGPGGGRITLYLVQLGAALTGLEVNTTMVAYLREAIPGATFVEGDLRDMSAVPDASSDAIFASNNVLDVTSFAERPGLLAELHRILAPGGTLVLSTHNRHAEANIRRPTQIRWGSPPRALIDLARLPKHWRNRRRVLPHERREEDWALLNDVSHDYTALHLYITREAQEQQLTDAGFALVECLDLDGRTLGPGDQAPTTEELHYVAVRP
jgi:SAM-dependent methyltransferase